ncbi:hypothetical protein GKS22_03720 [Streptococcus uberis]|uniref:hypothetical protein n=1 Tax=Streptococcus uberis TaxID=1349 RepID=UPI0012B5F34C|nr:hypothetical protein [Streptococcus uberis]MTB42827.1 hypothetical protein [Streptococcus uberis]
MNTFNLYNQIDEKLSNDIGLSVSDYTFYYGDINLEKMVIEKTISPFEEVVMSDIDDQWLAEQFPLTICQQIIINRPDLLFGPLGVTSKENKLGIGIHIHSKSSMFQKTVSVAEINYDEGRTIYDVEYTFEKSMLRGSISLDTFIYVKQLNKIFPLHADLQGMRVSKGNISEIKIIIDGRGSSFPIGEFSDPKGALWKLEMGAFDPTIDLFSFDNIRLLLNISHKNYVLLKENKTKLSKALMVEIMAQAMTLIISEVLAVTDIDLTEDIDVDEGTILVAVRYWISTFDININNIVDISNSIRKKLESNLSEEE